MTSREVIIPYWTMPLIAFSLLYDVTEMLVHRSEEAGYKAICLTVDIPVPGPKERDQRNQYVRTIEHGNFRSMRERQSGVISDETPDWKVAQVPPLT